MEKLKVTKVEDVRLQRRWRNDKVTLHLTQHHFIFRFTEGHERKPEDAADHGQDAKGKGRSINHQLSDEDCDELWISYHLIAQMIRLPSLLPSSISAAARQQREAFRLPHSGPSTSAGLQGGVPGFDTALTPSQRQRTISSRSGNGYVSQGRIYPLAVHLRDFETFGLGFQTEQAATDVFESIKACAILASMDQLYAFRYNEVHAAEVERPKVNGWELYDFRKEFARQGIGNRTKAWRFTDINANFTFCPTYPAQMVVPSRISDSTLSYACKYRSKGRIPALSYLHWANFGSITRSSQPMVGLNRNRSVQDEKLIEAIFTSHHFADPLSPAAAAAVSQGYGAEASPNSGFSAAAGAGLQVPVHSNGPRSNSPDGGRAEVTAVYGATSTNLIIDARPTTNAMANVAKGAGTENMDHYKGCKKAYLGVDNIHVMRDSLNKVVRTLRDADVPLAFEVEEGGESSKLLPMIDHQSLKRSSWLKHISALLEGSMLIVRNVHINSSHVLIHCSDGWDRTSQLSAIAQICLDPYYRTLEGFAVLVEKDWLSFGHRFMDRCGHLSHEKFFTTASGHGEPDSDDEREGEDTGDFEPVKAATALWGFGKSLAANFSSGPSSQSKTHVKEISPVFHQFLDCVWQIYRQFPARFEFNPAFLIELQKQLHTSTYGTFIYNCEKDRRKPDIDGIPPAQRSVSVWEYMFSEEMRPAWINKTYDKGLDDAKREHSDMGVLLADTRDLRFFAELFRREEVEMNSLIEAEIEEKRRFREAELAMESASLENGPSETAGILVSPAVASGAEDPVLNPIAAAAPKLAAQSGVTTRDLGTTTAAGTGGIPYKPYQSRQKPGARPTAASATPPTDESASAKPAAWGLGTQYAQQAQALASGESAQKMKALFSAGWGRLQEAVNTQLVDPTDPAYIASSSSAASQPAPERPRQAAVPHATAPSAPQARAASPHRSNPWAAARPDTLSDGLESSLAAKDRTARSAPGDVPLAKPAKGTQDRKADYDPLGVLG